MEITESNLDAPSAKLDEELRPLIIAEMKKLGINTDVLSPLTNAQLSDLLYGMNKLTILNKRCSSAAKSNSGTDTASLLSSIDKKLLKELVVSKGDVSMVALSRTLQVPLTTLQRRRKRIEDLLVRTFSLKYQEFAVRQITFLLTTEGHSGASVSKQVLTLVGITRAVQTLSNAVDLQIDAVVKTNREIADLAEQIKAIKGVRTVTWFESIAVLGEKKDTDLSIIDSA
ncbi:MAG: hypothetical protein ACREAY_06540 [Nitrososphaera sp.]|uniref:hypothetical protein n=1 Tax=Nitrososphaera sp. TaxID=1971748 RepID=UPI003D6FE4F3